MASRGIGGAERERLRAYSDRLVALVDAHVAAVGERPLMLPQLLVPIFALARERSAAGGNPAQENRAAILTLALYTTGRGVVAIVPAAHDWPRPTRLLVTLGGRDDFPMHFMISAALAMEGTSPLVNAIGLAKEMADSRHGMLPATEWRTGMDLASPRHGAGARREAFLKVGLRSSAECRRQRTPTR